MDSWSWPFLLFFSRRWLCLLRDLHSLFAISGPVGVTKERCHVSDKNRNPKITAESDKVQRDIWLSYIPVSGLSLKCSSIITSGLPRSDKELWWGRLFLLPGFGSACTAWGDELPAPGISGSGSSWVGSLLLGKLEQLLLSSTCSNEEVLMTMPDWWFVSGDSITLKEKEQKAIC